MSRPLRIEHAHALYHVTARGNEKRDIIRDDGDRARFTQLLAQTVKEQGLILYSWVLMDNHYHLVVETPRANLARSLRQINGVYTLWFNHKHRRSGHLFQGRYRSILVEKETYLKTLCRYVALNPVRARIVSDPMRYPWGSYRSIAGYEPVPDWLSAAQVLNLFHTKPYVARRAYRDFVKQDGFSSKSPWEQLEGQIYLGSREFLDRIRQKIDRNGLEIPSKQLRVRSSTPSEILHRVADVFKMKATDELFRKRRDSTPRRIAMYWMRVEGCMGLKAVGNQFGVGYSTVSHQVGWVRQEMTRNPNFKQQVMNCNPKT